MGRQYEIVHVIDRHWLIDSESYQRSYSVKGKAGLEPGVYVVLWPEHAQELSYDGDAEYRGPFKCRPDAEMAVREGRIDGLVEQRCV